MPIDLEIAMVLRVSQMVITIADWVSPWSLATITIADNDQDSTVTTSRSDIA